jgi:hypothetical protein
MPQSAELKPASPEVVANALAFALWRRGSKRTRDSPEIVVQIVAKRLVEHLERSGNVAERGRCGAQARA